MFVNIKGEFEGIRPGEENWAVETAMRIHNTRGSICNEVFIEYFNKKWNLMYPEGFNTEEGGEYWNEYSSAIQKIDDVLSEVIGVNQDKTRIVKLKGGVDAVLMFPKEAINGIIPAIIYGKIEDYQG